jgi:MoxR-like ATPase
MMQMQQAAHPIESLKKVIHGERIPELQQLVRKVHVVENMRRYILNLVHATRIDTDLVLGSSPRGSLALYRTSQAYAAMHGRDYVIPDDIKYIAVACLAHRMVMNPENILSGETTTDVVQEMLKQTEVPMTAA